MTHPSRANILCSVGQGTAVSVQQVAAKGRASGSCTQLDEREPRRRRAKADARGWRQRAAPLRGSHPPIALRQGTRTDAATPLPACVPAQPQRAGHETVAAPRVRRKHPCAGRG